MDPFTIFVGGAFMIASGITYGIGYKNKNKYEKIKNLPNIGGYKCDQNIPIYAGNSGTYWTSGQVTVDNPFEIIINDDIGKLDLIKYKIKYYDEYNISGNKNYVTQTSVGSYNYSYNKKVLRDSKRFAGYPVKINDIDISQLVDKLPQSYLGKQSKYVNKRIPSGGLDISTHVNQNGKLSMNLNTENIKHTYKTSKFYGFKNKDFLTVIGYYDQRSNSFVDNEDVIILSKPFDKYCDDLKSDYKTTMVVGHIFAGIGLGFVGCYLWNK